MVQNKSLIFKKIPESSLEIGEHFAVEDGTFDANAAPEAGGVTARNIWISFDPYMRGKMRDASIKSYSPAYILGKPISARAIAQVLKSDSSKWSPGDLVVTSDDNPIAEYTSFDKTRAEKLQKLENPYGVSPEICLGALGMPGLTSYASFYEIGKPKKGETIYISAAAGAVGQLVGQLAKHEGLRVIGSVGDDKKLDFILNEVGFDAGFNYKKESTKDALKRLCPDGIDIYFENVGGEQLQAALNAMNLFGRIIACGMISQYNLPADQQFPLRGLMQFVSKRILLQGFIVGDKNMGPKYYAEHQEKVGKWIADGTIKPKTDVVDGIDKAADALVGLFKGENFGKLVLKVGELQKDGRRSKM